MADVKALLRRFKAMDTRRGAWVPLWDECLDYYLPARTRFLDNEGSAGRLSADKRFDSTGTRFLRRLASTLQQLMASPSEAWFGISAVGLEDNQEVSEWLDNSAEKLFGALQRSNFYSALRPAYEDICCLGTTTVFVDELPIRTPGFNGFIFKALPPGESYIDENDLGEVDTHARAFRLTARQAALKFGEDKLHEDIRKELKRDDGVESKFRFIHMVYRRDDPALGDRKPMLDDRSVNGMEFASVYIDADHDEIVREGAFRDRRYLTARWQVSSGELYGRSPAMDSLPDTRNLNETERYMLEGLVMDIYPPWMVPDESVLGNLSLMPGAMNLYDSAMQGKFEPMKGGGNFAAAQTKQDQIRQSIAGSFMDDIFGLREGDGDVTATEVLDRRERRRQVAGPATAQIETELLDPLLSTCWKMMHRAGEFGRAPEALFQAERLEIDFISQMAQLQRMGWVRSLQDAFAIMAPLVEGQPQLMDNYDVDMMARDVPTDIGVPAKMLRDEDERDQMRQVRAQQQQRMLALQEGRETAKVASEVGREQ